MHWQAAKHGEKMAYTLKSSSVASQPSPKSPVPLLKRREGTSGYARLHTVQMQGDCSDCNNYLGTSLLIIVGKVFACVVLSRLQVLASRILPESQCGFRAEHSIVDMIFSI